MLASRPPGPRVAKRLARETGHAVLCRNLHRSTPNGEREPLLSTASDLQIGLLG